MGNHPTGIDVVERFQRQLVTALFLGKPLSKCLADDPAPAAVNPQGNLIKAHGKRLRDLCRDCAPIVGHSGVDTAIPARMNPGLRVPCMPVTLTLA